MNPAAHITPGIRLITAFLIKASLPSYLLFRTVSHCWPTIDAHLGWGCYTVLGSILISFLHIIYTHIQSIYHIYRAHQLNAHPLPSISGKLPGNLDLVRQWKRIWRTGYPGDISGTIMKQLGDVETYQAQVFWKNTVVTADPEIVREMLTTDHSNYVKGMQIFLPIELSASYSRRSELHNDHAIRPRVRRFQYQRRPLALSQEYV
jgi:hypothetical protein